MHFIQKKKEYEKAKKEMEDNLKKQLDENEREIESMKETYEQKLAEARAKAEELEKITKQNEKFKNCPHFANINSDPMLTGTLKYAIDLNSKKTKMVIGTSDKAEIQIQGLGVQDRHAGISFENNEYFIEPYNNSRVIRNGTQCDEKFKLNNFDRLVFGASHYYIFIDPTKFGKEKEIIDEKMRTITVEKIQQEIAEASGLISNMFDRKEPEELACINDLIDLLPYIEEANQMSIILDKKMKYESIILNPIVIGDPYSKIKVFYSFN